MFLEHRCIYTKDYNDKVIATKEDFDNCCTQCYEDVVQALDKEAFFKNEPADKVDAFAKLFIACNRLAAFTNATVDATLYPDDNSVSIFIASPIAEESRTHTVLSGKYLHLRQIKCSQYLILLRIFSLHLRNICSRKTALHPPALNFLMDFVKASRSKIRILQDEIWRKTRKILAAGRVSSTLFGYILFWNKRTFPVTPYILLCN